MDGIKYCSTVDALHDNVLRLSGVMKQGELVILRGTKSWLQVTNQKLWVLCMIGREKKSNQQLSIFFCEDF
jgi:hypothetical protein